MPRRGIAGALRFLASKRLEMPSDGEHISRLDIGHFNASISATTARCIWAGMATM
jgi:hypothetical protein